MIFSVCSDVGNVRKNNEDSYLIKRISPDADAWVFGVADGMGGHFAGDVASLLALESVSGYLDAHWPAAPGTEDVLNLLHDATIDANRRIYEYSLKHAGYLGMGTTVTICLHCNDTVSVAHIGDSRAYIINSGEIRQLTHDHSLVGEMVENGSLTEVEAMSHPQKNILTRALGTEQVAAVDLAEFQTRSGDVVLVCTDGLTNLIMKEEIAQAINNAVNFEQVAKDLVELAKARGGYDNITVLAAKI